MEDGKEYQRSGRTLRSIGVSARDTRGKGNPRIKSLAGETSYTTSPKICNNRTQARKDDSMKVNYPERIEDTVTELKIIMSQQRTVATRQKVQALYLLKSGFSQSITDVSEVLGVHRAC